MSIGTILVATDFSEAGELAVAQGLQIARKCGSELILLHIGDVPELRTPVPEEMAPVAREFERVRKERFEEHRAALEALRERIDGQGAVVSHLMVTGFPDEVIPAVAAERGADLTVLGSRGHAGLRRFLLGSTVERVVRHSTNNVMVARAGELGEPRGGYKSVLVPLELSEVDDAIIDVALEVVAPEGTLHLVHFFQLPGAIYLKGKAGLDWALELRRSIGDGCERRLRAVEDKVSSRHGGVVTHSLAEDDPRHGIDRMLESGANDLVVMGSHGRRGLKRWTLGSVAEVTVRHAPCSVLVVHRLGHG